MGKASESKTLPVTSMLEEKAAPTNPDVVARKNSLADLFGDDDDECAVDYESDTDYIVKSSSEPSTSPKMPKRHRRSVLLHVRFRPAVIRTRVRFQTTALQTQGSRAGYMPYPRQQEVVTMSSRMTSMALSAGSWPKRPLPKKEPRSLAKGCIPVLTMGSI